MWVGGDVRFSIQRGDCLTCNLLVWIEDILWDGKEECGGGSIVWVVD
jgi:hypothetical protein